MFARYITFEEMRFQDRTEAGELLASALLKYKGNKDVLVLAIPLGGIPVADVIAKKLELPLDVIMCKKIGYPNNPSFAIGAVTLEGFAVNIEDVPGDYIMAKVQEIQTVLKKQYKQFAGTHKRPEIKGKTVIIVDEGVMTGNTLSLTLDILRHKEPAKVIVAVPVAPPEALRLLASDADHIFCLTAPDNFTSIANFYESFDEISEDKAIVTVKDAHERMLNKSH